MDAVFLVPPAKGTRPVTRSARVPQASYNRGRRWLVSASCVSIPLARRLPPYCLGVICEFMSKHGTW